MNETKLLARRAVEALRLGVPTAASVKALPPKQPDVDRMFLRLLNDAGAAGGFLIEANFGSGKSHLLTHLVGKAHELGYATSYVSISKETSTADPTSIYRSAIESLEYPDKRLGGSLMESFESLNRRGEKYVAFFRELSALSDILSASLTLHEGHLADQEAIEYFVGLWDGSPVEMAVLKRYARAINVDLRHLKAKDANSFAFERFSATTALLKITGCLGWVIIIDELELIAKFSFLARARSYGNIGSFFSPASAGNNPFFVGAVTPDFREEVFGTRDDKARIQTLVNRGELLGRANAGIQFLDDRNRRIRLRTLDVDELKAALIAVGDVYRLAYTVTNIDQAPLDHVDQARSLRALIREWVTRWDIQQVYGESPNQIVVDEVRENLAEAEEFAYDEK